MIIMPHYNYIGRHILHAKCWEHFRNSPGFRPRLMREIHRAMLGCVTRRATFRMKDINDNNVTRKHIETICWVARGFFGNSLIILADQPTLTLHLLITINHKRYNFKPKELQSVLKLKSDPSTKMSDNRADKPNSEQTASFQGEGNDHIPIVDLDSGTTSCDDTDPLDTNNVDPRETEALSDKSKFGGQIESDPLTKLVSDNQEGTSACDQSTRPPMMGEEETETPVVDLASSTNSCEDTDTQDTEGAGLRTTMTFRSAMDDTAEDEVIYLEDDGEDSEDNLQAEPPEAREDRPVYVPSVYAPSGDGRVVDEDEQLLEVLQRNIKIRGGALNAQRVNPRMSAKTSPRRSPRTSMRVTPMSSPRTSPQKSPLKSLLKSPLKSPMKSPIIRRMKSPRKSLVRSPEKSPEKSHKNDPVDTLSLAPDDLRHLIEHEKERIRRSHFPEVEGQGQDPERERQERSVRKKLFEEKEPSTQKVIITMDQLSQGLNLATPSHTVPHPHPNNESWRETPTETRTRRAYVKNIRKARSLKTEVQKTDPTDERKPVLDTNSTNSTETLEVKHGVPIKVKDMKSLLKNESDNQAMDDGFSHSEENALRIIGIIPPTTVTEGLCGCQSLCRGTDGYGRCLSLPPLDPPIEDPILGMSRLPNAGEPFMEDPRQEIGVVDEQIYPITERGDHDAGDTTISMSRGATGGQNKAINECHRAVSTGHHLPDFFNQGANIDALISETIDELAQRRATREALENEDMGHEIGAASLLGTQRVITEQIFRLVDRLRVLNYERRNLMEEIQAQQEILDEFVREGVNTTASPSSPSAGPSQEDSGTPATKNAAQKTTQKINCANQIKWDRFAGFLPNPKTFWRGLEYNYVYNDEDYDWFYDEEDEQIRVMDVDGDVGTPPTQSANISWYCACERGRCICDDKSRDDPNHNYNLNDTD